MNLPKQERIHQFWRMKLLMTRLFDFFFCVSCFLVALFSLFFKKMIERRRGQVSNGDVDAAVTATVAVGTAPVLNWCLIAWTQYLPLSWTALSGALYIT